MTQNDTGPVPATCPNCNLSYYGERNEATGRPEFDCSRCDEVFELCIVGGSSAMCPGCNETGHVTRHANSPEQLYSCTKCNTKQDAYEPYEVGGNLARCPNCREAGTVWKNADPSGDPQFACANCKTIFSRQDMLDCPNCQVGYVQVGIDERGRPYCFCGACEHAFDVADVARQAVLAAVGSAMTNYGSLSVSSAVGSWNAGSSANQAMSSIALSMIGGMLLTATVESDADQPPGG